MARATLGVIVGNRDFFPDALVTEARADVVSLFEEMDITPIMVAPEATKLGGVETRSEVLSSVLASAWSEAGDRWGPDAADWD